MKKTAMLGSAIDDTSAGTTRRRRPTATLRYALQRFVHASRQAMVAFWGSDHIVLAANTEALAFLPAPAQRPSGTALRDTWPELADHLEPLLNAAFAGRPCRLGESSTWIDRSSGARTEHFSSTFAPIPFPDGSSAGTLWTLVDTTTQVRAAAFLNALLDGAGLRVLQLATPSLTVDWASPSVLRALGPARGALDPLALVGRPASEVLPSPVIRALHEAARSSHPLAIDLPQLGERYTVQRVQREGGTPILFVLAHPLPALPTA